LIVTLGYGNQVFQATELDSIEKSPKDGTFFPIGTVYRFETPVLYPDNYSLTIEDPRDSSVFIQAHTRLPNAPDIFRPRQKIDPDSGSVCLAQLNISGSDSIIYTPQNESVFLQHIIRFYLSYRQDSIPKLATWGSETPFKARAVYPFLNGNVLNGFRNILSDSTAYYSIEDTRECEDFSQYFWVEISRLDSALTQYSLSENPDAGYLDAYKPTYTNLSGQPKPLGVFGSAGVKRVYLKMTQEEKILLRLH
jgi:hypothetical protein